MIDYDIEDGTEFTKSHWTTKWGTPKRPPIINIDFDHTMTTDCPSCPGWNGEHHLQREAKETIIELKKLGFMIVVWSSGANYDGFGNYENIIADFMKKHDIPYDRIDGFKPPAMFIVDDRAIHHTGWGNTLKQIKFRLGDQNSGK